MKCPICNKNVRWWQNKISFSDYKTDVLEKQYHYKCYPYYKDLERMNK
jgi:hypothetical protein